MSIKAQTGTEFLEEFLDLLNSGRINAIAPDDREASGAAFKMYLALSSILAGADPNDALQINRKKGVKKKPHSLSLAIFIYWHKYEMGEKWSVVEVLAKVWLADRGLPALSLPGLKKHYGRYREEVEALIERRDHFCKHPARSSSRCEDASGIDTRTKTDTLS